MKLNGAGTRRVDSWIDSFIESTEVLDTPRIYRRWAAITTIASVLEQKVWMQTATELFPNIYSVLVGAPGLGKTRAIYAAIPYLRELPEFHIAPTSLTSASLVDALTEAKRMIIQLPDPPLEYNTMLIAADELGTFVHHEDRQVFEILSAFYDPRPYGQDRRGKEIKVRIKRPQVNILCGSTPTTLLKLLPDSAWDQGFTSRLMLIYSEERIISDDVFAAQEDPFVTKLMDDLRVINSISGCFEASSDFRDMVNNWLHSEDKGPDHPRLTHYCTRRLAHLLKLTMISAVDRSNALFLSVDDFHRAISWLSEAELSMGGIFKAGSISADSKAMDEIQHFVRMNDKGRGVLETKVFNFARERVPSLTITRLIEIMIKSGLIAVVNANKDGTNRWFNAPNHD